MLCGKCKTATINSSKTCQYCGAKLGLNYKLIAASIFIIALILLLLYIIVMEAGSRIEQKRVTEVFNPTEADEVLKPAESIIYEQPKPDNIEVQTNSDFQPKTGITQEQAWALMEEVLATAASYFEENMETNVIITKNGYLYDNTEKEYIQPDENVLLLYINPEHIKHIEGIEIKSELPLEVFSAYEMREGVALLSQSGEKAIIEREKLKEVLSRYEQSGGKVAEFTSDSQSFSEIIAALSAESEANIFDVRYMAGDEKFAYATLYNSEAGEYLAYLLRRKNSNWEIAYKASAGDGLLKQNINKAFPSFNIDVMPEFNIYGHNLSPDIKPDTLVSYMLETEIITEADKDIVFFSAADNFVYLISSRGDKFAGFIPIDGEWRIQAVKDNSEAVGFMEAIQEKPPYFILPVE